MPFQKGNKLGTRVHKKLVAAMDVKPRVAKPPKAVSRQETGEIVQAALDQPWRYLPHTLAMHLSDGKWKPYSYLVFVSHLIATVMAQGGGRIIVEWPPRHGKLIAHDTPILTPDGWRTHGDLRPGDRVFGRDGHPVMVEGIAPEDIADYEVCFDDGAVIQTHANHEWLVWSRKHPYDYRLMTTQNLHQTNIRNGEANKRGNRNLYSVDHNVCLEFPERDLPLHPYFVGAWLGDGSTTKGCITYARQDDAVIEKIISLGYVISGHNVHATTGVLTDYIEGAQRSLRECGLLGHKHIPDLYMFSSKQQREELLAGLIDTDGNLDPQGRVRIVSVSLELVTQIQELVRSLGGKAYIMSQQPILSSSGIQGKQVVYTVGFNYDEPLPVALVRKRTALHRQRKSRRSVTEVRKVAGKPGRCIQVQGGIYLVGPTSVPTHNSLFLSQWLPVWFLANWPDQSVILATYESTFAASWGKRVRNLIAQHGDELGVHVSDDSAAAALWTTTAGGGMITAGVGAGITGRGGRLLLIDDPHKNWQEAMSSTICQGIHDWFDSTFYTRLEPGGTLVVTHTRWAQNDLIGYLIDQHPEEKWIVVRFPALAEEEDVLGRKAGQALCPERYNEVALAKIKTVLGLQMWNGLYQQRPSAIEGDIWQRARWKYYHADPVCSFVIQSWDTGFKRLGEHTAYSVCQTWGVFPNGYCLLNQWRDRVEYPELEKMARLQYATWRPHAVLIEDKASGQSLIQSLQRNTSIPIIPVNPQNDGDKVTRALAVTPLHEAGLLWLSGMPDDELWVGEMVERFTTFPNGNFKDEIDAASQALSYLRDFAAVGEIQSALRRSTGKILEGFRQLIGTTKIRA